MCHVVPLYRVIRRHMHSNSRPVEISTSMLYINQIFYDTMAIKKISLQLLNNIKYFLGILLHVHRLLRLLLQNRTAFIPLCYTIVCINLWKPRSQMPLSSQFYPIILHVFIVKYYTDLPLSPKCELQKWLEPK